MRRFLPYHKATRMHGYGVGVTPDPFFVSHDCPRAEHTHRIHLPCSRSPDEPSRHTFAAVPSLTSPFPSAFPFPFPIALRTCQKAVDNLLITFFNFFHFPPCNPNGILINYVPKPPIGGRTKTTKKRKDSTMKKLETGAKLGVCVCGGTIPKTGGFIKGLGLAKYLVAGLWKSLKEGKGLLP